MYDHITDENPYKVPMRIYPAVHYTMGGLWVDYNLMTTIPGLFCLGEANFSDHGANRLGASALMQGLADGYFVLPYTIGDYLAGTKLGKVERGARRVQGGRGRRGRAHDQAASASRARRRLSELHRKLGHDHVGQGRHGAQRQGPERGAAGRSPRSARSSGRPSRSPAPARSFNQTLERAGRVADFLEFGELLAKDALAREESCGGHFREEHQTPDGEAKRDDENFSHVAAWEYKGEGKAPERHVEPLTFENVHIAQRNYA